MHKIIGLLAASVLSAGAAQAALFGTTTAVTTAPSSSSSPTDLPTDWTHGQVVLTLPKFNQSLGTLQSVTLQFSGNLLADYTATSLDQDPQTLISRLSGSMEFQLPGGAIETLTLLAESPETLEPGETITGDISAFKTSTRTLSTDLDGFIGAGNVGIGVLASARWTLTGGDAQTRASTVGNASAQVTYNYTPAQVPEPASLALAALALGAAGLARRSRRA